jgi:phosphate-selective porin OprO/OprP
VSATVEDRVNVKPICETRRYFPFAKMNFHRRHLVFVLVEWLALLTGTFVWADELEEVAPGSNAALEARVRELESQNQALSQQYEDVLKRLDSLSRQLNQQDRVSSGGMANLLGPPEPTDDRLSPLTNSEEPPTSSAISALSPELGGDAPDTPKSTRKRIKGRVFLENGVNLASEDEEFSIEFHNETQVDYRLNTMGHLGQTVNGFAIPRERFYFQGRLTKLIEYRLVMTRGFITQQDLLDAYLTFRLKDDRVQARIGRYRAPYSYEWWMEPNQYFINPERSVFNANLGLNRMIGAALTGKVFEDRFDYAVGIFDGPRNSFEDYNSGKDIVSYLNFRPWANSKEYRFLEYLNLGGSVDYGNQENPTQPQSFRTSANATSNAAVNRVAPSFLALNNNIIESGIRSQWSMHAAYFYKRLSLIAEWQSGFADYARNTQKAYRTRLPYSGFYVQAGYFLTGEEVKDRSQVKPIRPFSLRPGKLGPGAIELASRISTLNLGPQVFSAGLADPNLWTRNVVVTDFGVNWYINQYIKILFDWQYSALGQPVMLGPGHYTNDFNLFWTRFQIYY